MNGTNPLAIAPKLTKVKSLCINSRMFMLAHIPMALVILRGAIAPVLVGMAWDGHTSWGWVLLYCLAVLSDIFDGIIARRLGVSTAALRKADSWADRGLYVCVAIAAWLAHPDVILAFKLPLLTILGLQGIWWIVNLAKYGQPASYHTYTAKAWGLTLLVAAIALFGYGYGGVTLWAAILIGVIHTLEELAMTWALPTWHHDVLSLGHALEIRKQLSS